MDLLWLLVAVGTASCGVQGDSTSSKQPVSRVQNFSSRIINEYFSYSDMEIMVVRVPEATLSMKLYFDLEARQSSNCKMSSVEVYYQYGAPPLPPQQTFQKGSYTKRDYSGNQVIAMDTKEPLSKPFSCALPGQWYIGVLLPKSNGVKRISELGFGNSSTKECSFNVGMKAALTVVKDQVIIPSSGEIIQDTLFVGQETRYYKYQKITNSSKLTVTISNCYHIKESGKRIEDCPLTLSIRANGLPVEGKSPSLGCFNEVEHCSITMPTLEQANSNYFITLTRMPIGSSINVYFNISIVISGCPTYPQPEELNPGCVSVQEMFPITAGKVLNQRFYPNQWNSTIILPTRRQPSFFSLSIPESHVGSMLAVHTSFRPPNPYQSGSGLVLCLQKDYAPYFYIDYESYRMDCAGHKGYVNSTDDVVSRSVMFVPFPEKGTWYISIYQPEPSPYYSPKASVELFVQIQGCMDDCSNRGTCMINTRPDLVYGMCSCNIGYTGWACEGEAHIKVLSVCLLTLSNLVFAADALIAVRLRMFPEMMVYLFLTLMSTLYHLCKSQIVCAMDEGFLQLCDFYAIALSLWVTLVAMANLSSHAYTATLNMVAVLVLFVAVREAGQSILPFVLTLVIAFVFVVLYHAVMWCRGKPVASFSKKRWALFILPATILIILCFLIFGLFETTDEYQYVHSVGHMFLGLGIALLLPNHRYRVSHYDVSRELNAETTNSRAPLLINQVRHV